MYDLLLLLKKQNVTSQTSENLRHPSYALSFKKLIFFVFSFFLLALIPFCLLFLKWFHNIRSIGENLFKVTKKTRKR